MTNTTGFSYSTFTEFNELWHAQFTHLLNLRSKTNTCRECHVTITSTDGASFRCETTGNTETEWRSVFRGGKTQV